MFQTRRWILLPLVTEFGKMEISDSKKYALMFGGGLVAAGLVLSTVVFPFWNLIREEVKEEVEILRSKDGVCYVETSDKIPKTIKNCNLDLGSQVTIKYGKGLAWAEIVNP